MREKPEEHPAESMRDPLKRLISAVIEHSNHWGSIWFGLIFLGSVLNAVFGVALGHSPEPALTLVAYVVGLLLGIQAKLRGNWL
jgi:hypothetical protein